MDLLIQKLSQLTDAITRLVTLKTTEDSANRHAGLFTEQDGKQMEARLTTVIRSLNVISDADQRVLDGLLSRQRRETRKLQQLATQTPNS